MRRARELTFRGGDSKQDEPNWRGVKGQFTAEAQRTQRLRSEDEREWKREKKRFPVISLHLLGVLGAAAVNLTLLLLRYPTRTNRPVAIFVFAILTFSPCAFAQFRPLGEQNAEGGARANQLPLSGRSGQTGTVTTTQTPTPGTTTSVNTINPTIQTQGSFGGSAAGAARVPFSGRLSLREAVARGIEFNLGAVGLTNAVIESRGQRKVARSALLPNLSGYLGETVQQINLQASGLNFTQQLGQQITGLSIPTVIGPFNFFDLRATLNQRVIDVTAWKNYRSAKEIVRANEETAEDSSDLVVLAVGGAYLQVIAAQARIDAARANLETANALYRQALEKRSAGIIAQTDVNRAQIQALTEQQRLVTLQNDLAKQKINLARLTGLPTNEFYDITDPVPFSPAPPIPFDQALRLAFEQRSDLRAAEAQVSAAKKALSAARAERIPSFSIYADYGVIGKNPSQSHGTFTVVGTLNFPIWLGGRIKGDIQQAEAALAQRYAELEDIKGQIERDVRFAYLDMQAASSQVDVALKNIQTARQNLDLTRQRFDAGVSDNVEVVQSQEDVATAQLDYINSVFAHNVAKLSLARAIGRAAEDLPFFLRMQ
jgi:outer membrane protein TolC